jgi:hypothetical protein
MVRAGTREKVGTRHCLGHVSQGWSKDSDGLWR